MPTLPPSLRRRQLYAARVVGVAALGVVGQVAVDLPGGYLGAADTTTPFGLAYGGALVVAAVVLAVAAYRGWRPAGWLVPGLFAVNVGVFLPAFVADPVVAGTVGVWNLLLLAQSLFPPPDGAPRPEPGSEVSGWLVRHGPALHHLALAALLLTLGVVGYRLSGHPLAQGVVLVLGYATLALAAPLGVRLHREGSRVPWLLLPPAAASAVLFARPGWMLSLLAVALAGLLAVLAARRRSTVELLRGFYDQPSRLIVGSFAALVLLGTVLLTFPAASPGAGSVEPLDALFTATSASCVTGLVVLDTPGDFTVLGQAMILVLIQVGGLGIMVLGTFATLLLGGNLGLRGEQALTEMLELETASTAYRLTRFIVLVTLAVEGVGAVGLTVFFRGTGMGWGEAAWNGVFHAVSAFCNAGFALWSDSLVPFQGSTWALLLVSVLIVLGGLGFAVLAALGTRLLRRGGGDRRPVSTQVRVVLATTVVLLLAGWVLFAALEWDGALEGLSVTDKLVNALFQSVTLRTAGFNTVDLARLAPVSVLFIMAFMFVGASPGSTGGGIKNTTAAVLLAAIRASAHRREPVHLFGREVPRDVVYRSLAIVVISGGIVLGGLFLLLLFEPQPFLHLAFEVVSAFGTVGLSLGATAQLGPVGKLIIIGLMFVGRIGPLTLALLLGTGIRRPASYHYPPTRLMVG